MTSGYYRTSSPVTALPMIMRWISDVPSKIVKILVARASLLPVTTAATGERRLRQPNPQLPELGASTAGARVMIADAVRYMSVDSYRDPDSAGLRWTTLPTEPEFGLFVSALNRR
jgi:hypothetical protein